MVTKREVLPSENNTFFEGGAWKGFSKKWIIWSGPGREAESK
jgi:hypothetical protein